MTIDFHRSTIKKVLIVSFVILLFIAVVSAENINLLIIEIQIQNHYSNWDKTEYKDWDCSETSVECEKYFETHGYTCYLVYGDRTDKAGKMYAHMWNIVIIDGKYYEFESTTLEFKDVSSEYNIHMIQEGFYVNSIKYNKCQPLDNWEDILHV